MRRRRFHVFRAVVFCLLAVACSAPERGGEPALLELPTVHTDTMGEAVQRQLRTERAKVETLLAASEQPSAELGAAFGRLGRLYQAYDLPEAAIVCYRNAHRLAPETFSWPYLLGYQLYLEGDLEDAGTALATALELRGQDSPANLWAGHARLGLSDPEGATDFFTRALAADPACAGARFGLGEAARARGELGVAITHYLAVLEQQPEAAVVHYPLALALRDTGRTEEAESHFQLAAERRTARGGWAGCADPEVAAVSHLATGSAAAILRASEAGAAGDLDAEIAAYRQAAEADPGDAVALRALGSALWQAGDAEGAIARLEQAQALAPDDPAVHYDFGFVLAKTGDLARSEQHLLRAVELHPDYPEAHLMLGTLYQRHRLFQPALAHYEQVLSRDPGLLAARLQRALALAELERRDEALADLRALAAEAPPVDPQEELNLASALARLGDRELAGRMLLALTRDNAAPAELQARAHFNLGMIALEQRSPDAAIPHFRAARDLSPGFEQAERGLRQALRLSG